MGRVILVLLGDIFIISHKHIAIDVGDMVIVKHVKAEEVDEGDVVQYRRSDMTVIHRVVSVQDYGNSRAFVTQGDANNQPDQELVLPEQIMGKVELRIPKVGWLSLGIKNFLRTVTRIAPG